MNLKSFKADLDALFDEHCYSNGDDGTCSNPGCGIKPAGYWWSDKKTGRPSHLTEKVVELLLRHQETERATLAAMATSAFPPITGEDLQRFKDKLRAAMAGGLVHIPADRQFEMTRVEPCAEESTSTRPPACPSCGSPDPWAVRLECADPWHPDVLSDVLNTAREHAPPRIQPIIEPTETDPGDDPYEAP